MATKTWKRTEKDTKDVKLAPQAKIVLQAIDELKTAGMKEWGTKCVELGLKTVQGTDRIIAWYKPVLLKNELIIECEQIKQEKPAKVKKEIKVETQTDSETIKTETPKAKKSTKK